jgi:hypothetical protein
MLRWVPGYENTRIRFNVRNTLYEYDISYT